MRVPAITSRIYFSGEQTVKRKEDKKEKPQITMLKPSFISKDPEDLKRLEEEERKKMEAWQQLLVRPQKYRKDDNEDKKAN